MIRVIQSIDRMRDAVREVRARNLVVGLVPTMPLHRGSIGQIAVFFYDYFVDILIGFKQSVQCIPVGIFKIVLNM